MVSKLNAKIDRINHKSISGWLVNLENVELSFELKKNGAPITINTQFLPRNDLAKISGAVGFKVSFTDDIKSSEFCNGTAILYVIASGSQEIVNVWDLLALSELISSLSENESNTLVELLKNTRIVPLVAKAAKKNFKRDLSISCDGIAVKGGNGHYFLYEGSNQLNSQYGEAVNEKLVQRWLDIFNNRKIISKDIDAAFFQVLIPEKASVLSPLSLFHSGGNTPTYSTICSEANDSYLIDIGKFLQNRSDSSIFYRVYDTHFTSHGAKEVIKAILQHVFNLEILISYSGNKFVKRQGDVASKFDNFEMEVIEEYDKLYWNSAEIKSPELINRFDPEGNKHLGIKRVWKNTSAPINKKVICFGNSFFERGLSSCCLSWWASRLFSEFHFIWSPDYDVDYIKSTGGCDIVFCQTIERFLNNLAEK